MLHSIHPRKPIVALLMSLLLPGFGQLYNGHVNKAIHLFLGFALLSVPGIALVALYLPSVLMMPLLLLSLALALGIWLYGMVDAWRGAKRQDSYELQAWQLSGVYLLVFLLCNTLALPLLIDYVRVHQVASYRIPSTSMEPSLLQGDVFFADKRYNCPGCNSAVQRGDVAIFTYPNNRTLSYIKRVIGLPGDRVRIQGHDVWVNGTPLKVGETQTPSGLTVTESLAGRTWVVQWTAPDKRSTETDLTVPPGQALVLGDNRSTSQDTRQFGTVPLQDIVGKASHIWFSMGAGDGIRWSRFGRAVL